MNEITDKMGNSHNFSNLVEGAKKKGVDVLVSLATCSAKAVLPEHRKKIVCEVDEEGVYYTEDHVSFCRIPRVVV